MLLCKVSRARRNLTTTNEKMRWQCHYVGHRRLFAVVEGKVHWDEGKDRRHEFVAMKAGKMHCG